MLSAYPQEYGYGDFYFGPTVDGTFIRDLPSNEFQNGHFAKVPLITNRDGYEGMYSLPSPPIVPIVSTC